MHDSARTTDVLLLPGEYFVGGESYRMRTVLGSCVSIILWHPCRRIGAMSHFLLSGRRGKAGIDALDARYGEEAMLLMLEALRMHEVPAAECKGKIFGGGSMYGSRCQALGDVGRRNGEAARALLRAHGIAKASESLFGRGHRQVIFDVRTGDVWARQVPPVEVPARVLQ